MKIKHYSTPSLEANNTFSFLKDENGRKATFKPRNDIEDPIALCKRLGLADDASDFMNKKPLVGLTSQGRIWEYYIIGLFIDEFHIKNAYKKLKKKIPEEKNAYPSCNKSEIGNEHYDYWCNLYQNKIKPTKKQQNQMRPFVKALIDSGRPLREIYDKKLTQLRAKAAKAFFEYLKSDFFSSKKSLKAFCEKGFYEQLQYLFSLPNFSKKYLLNICLLLCLYGCNYQLEDNTFCIESEFVSKVQNQLKKLSINKDDEDFRDEVVSALSCNKKCEFYPPYSYVYQYWRERIRIYKHLNVWIKLVCDTYKAMNCEG